jgi:hypothetical protein
MFHTRDTAADRDDRPRKTVFKLSAPQAHQLARRVRSWHASQDDPLPLARCQHIVAVLHGHASWTALQAAARTNGEPTATTLEVARLKHFGYTTDAAKRLVAYLSTETTIRH